MFKWYKSATICYAYLADIPFGKAEKLTTSRWFTRGWTLQELIAPAMVEFYSYEWTNIGTKSSLRGLISARTGIKSHILLGGDLSKCNIAEKMSWASDRHTSRVEDSAYCLLGIFNVNIPMLYGEGDKAFIRLQQEILSREVDYSIFTWSDLWFGGQTSILAPSPYQFSRSVPGRKRSVSKFLPSGFDHLTQEPGFSEPYSITVVEDYSKLVPISPDILGSITGIYKGAQDPPMMTSWGLRLTALVNEVELCCKARIIFLGLQYKGGYLCIMEVNQLRHDARFIFSCNAEELKKFSYKSLYFDVKTHLSFSTSPIIAPGLRCIKLQYQESPGDYTAKLLAVSTRFGQWIELRTDSIFDENTYNPVFCIALFRFVHEEMVPHLEFLDSPDQDRVIAVVLGQRHIPICTIHPGSASAENLQRLYNFYAGLDMQQVAADQAEKLVIDKAKELAVDRDAFYINSNTIASAIFRRISGNDGNASVTHILSIDTHQVGHSPAWVRSILESKRLSNS